MPGRARLSIVDHVLLKSPLAAGSAMQWFYGEFLGLAPIPDDPDRQESPLMLRYRSDRFELRIALSEGVANSSVPRRLTVEVPSLEEAALVLDERNYPYDWLKGLRFTDRAIMLLDPADNRVMLRRLWMQSVV